MVVGPLDRQPDALLFLAAADPLRSRRGVEGAERGASAGFFDEHGDGDGEHAEDRHDQDCWTSQSDDHQYVGQ